MSLSNTIICSDPDLTLKPWEDVQAFFDKNLPKFIFGDCKGDLRVRVGIDASDIIQFLRISSKLEIDGNPQAIDKRFSLNRKSGKKLFSSSLSIFLFSTSDRRVLHYSSEIINMFLQQFFVAVNIAMPGALNLWYDGVSVESEKEVLPVYFSDLFNSARYQADERKWPPLKQLPFGVVWSWLHDKYWYRLNVANEPWQKASFAILRLAVRNACQEDQVLVIARALEALFVDGREGIGTLLKTRLQLVIGIPPTHKKWFSKFYNLRSKIAHGSSPMLKPEIKFRDCSYVNNLLESYFEPIDTATAVLLSVLQDLTQHGIYSYQFEQTLKR
ncbi:MAG: hypothetical protein D3924_08080 [Candidatus Electrothrix sp. AR4]|nr:hypothetical protein [Candidatus Electrothrix sp. AR4]